MEIFLVIAMCLIVGMAMGYKLGWHGGNLRGFQEGLVAARLNQIVLPRMPTEPDTDATLVAFQGTVSHIDTPPTHTSGEPRLTF